MSSKYTGSWKDNLKDGFGIQVFENGNKYEGDWKNNKMNGQGTLWILDQKRSLRRRYTGDWVNGKKHGRGTMFFPNEDRYDGFWMDNEPQGEGRMIYRNGDVYVGQWSAGKRSGYGVLTKRNGDHFEGNWVHDKREGQGSYFFESKNKLFVGEYVNDNPKSGVYSEVEDPSKPPADPDKLPDFDDVPPLPSLQLRDPSAVLQNALSRVKARRMFYRAKFMTLQVLYTHEELLEIKREFEAVWDGQTTEEEGYGDKLINLNQVLLILENLGIEADEESAREYLEKLHLEIPDDETFIPEEDEDDFDENFIDFETVARLVAIILEINNRLKEELEIDDDMEDTFIDEEEEEMEEDEFNED